jgi:hypothetical protein
MFDYLPGASGRSPAVPDMPHRPLAVFVAAHIDGLLNAAALLAGPRGERLVQAIHERLLSSNPINRHTHRALQDLLEILSLEHVGDPDRAEAGFFAAIDPADPCVADICLLTDRYRAALSSAGLDQPQFPWRTAE